MLELRSVTAGYGEIDVVRDVSLRVGAGRVGALLGPNGAGKTTLLRAASGLLVPRSGTVVVDGTDVTGRPAHEIAAGGVCHVPQGRAIFPTLTVRDNIRAFAAPGEEASALEMMASAFPVLGRRAGQAAGTLSGGEQQMLAMARAWIRGPALVLVDEPTLGLAPRIVDEVYEFLARLAGQGTAMLLVEQYVDKALGIADDVHVLVNGTLAHSGPAAELDRETLAEHYVAVTT